MSSIKSNFSRFSKPLGFFLIALSTLCWVTVFIIPFLDFDVLEIAGIITALIVVAEICFFIAILFLGKEYWQSIKAKITQLLESAKNS